MSNDSYPAGRVPLRGPAGTGPDWDRDLAASRVSRRKGINRARWMSNWTAAALITGTGAAVIALAHNAVPAAAPVTATGSVAAGSGASTHSGAAGGAVAASQGAPAAAHSVATTSASGVTTITTTNPVTGHKTVTKVRHGGSRSDD